MPRPLLLTRRGALLGLTAAWSLRGASLALAAAPTDRRLVVVLLRGALDGMAAVTPYGDPDLTSWRPGLLLPEPGRDGGLLDMGGFWGMHPALAGLHAMYRGGELLPVHAISGGWHTRSHFEAQDCLEGGVTQDGRITSGWLNRVAGLVRAPGPNGAALAPGLDMPLILRGPAPVASWAPSTAGLPSPDLYARLAALSASDPLLGPAVADGLRERGFATGVFTGGAAPGLAVPGTGDRSDAFAAMATAAGRLLAARDGPRLAALEIGGWDTHASQLNRLQTPLASLDAGMVALRDALGAAWSTTVVLCATEFGRTVRANGTGGTDHGTASVAFVAGGSVAGGQVRAAWPALARGSLFEDRDLQPTADLRGLAKGLLADHLGLAPQALATVFPDSADAMPLRGLLRI